MGSEFGGTIELEYGGTAAGLTREDILDVALSDWRGFIGDPEAPLPWNTSLKVICHETSYEATVTIRWERVTT